MILNLITPATKLEIIKFPDGQQDVRIKRVQPSDDVWIYSRMNSFKDVELIICTVKALKGLGVESKQVSLYVPYMLGGRSDKKFIDGGNN
jgi:phosphoribosylpyrophosphate synthetase